MTARKYSNTAIETTLSNPIGTGDTSISVGATTGFPASFPYTLTLDYETSVAEVVLVTAAAGSTLTVTRGYGSTSAQSHNAGAVVVHVVEAAHFNDTENHVDATDNVHGIGASASVVGTDTVQTLTNKTISGASNTLTALPADALTGDHREVTAVAQLAANVPITAKGAASQTADLIRAVDSADADKFGVEPDGDIRVTKDANVTGAVTAASVAATGAATARTVTATATAATDVPVTAKGAAAHSANMIEAKDSTDVVTFSVSPSGNVTASHAELGTADLDTGGAATSSVLVVGGAGVDALSTVKIANAAIMDKALDVEGDMEVTGDVTVTSGGIVAANMRAVQVEQEPNVSSTSATYVSLGTDDVSFTLPYPASGVVLFHLAARAQPDTADTGACLMSFEIRDTDSTGTLRLAADDSRAVYSDVENREPLMNMSYLASGLPTSGTMYVRAQYRVESGSGEWFYRRMIAVPQP